MPIVADDVTVPDLLARRAAADPDRAALIVDGGGSLTYGAWHDGSIAVARGLAGHGVRAGDRVGLLFAESDWPDFAVAYCGVLAAGAVAVPLSAASTASQLEACLRHCGADAVIHSAALPAPAVGGWAGSIGELTARPGGADVPARPSPGSAAQILYTSGTTGKPRAVTASHANLVYEYVQRPRPAAYAHSEHALHAFPLATNAAMTMLVKALHMRPTTVVLPRFHPQRLCALVESYRIGSVFGVPAMWIALLNWGGHERFDMSSIVLIGSSAAPLPTALAGRLAAAFPAATVVNQYTSTEAWPAQTVMIYDPERPASVGRPADGSAIRVAGADGRPLPPGEVGDVWLASPAGVQRRYYGDDAGNDHVFRAGWVRLGDVGYLDDDGYLCLAGRDGEIINSGGKKIAGVDVENALYAHPDVADAAAFGVPHKLLGEALVAAVVLRSPAGADGGDIAGGVGRADALRAFLRERLADHQVPQRIHLVEALPRNANGKVLKTVLRDRFGGAPVP